MRKLPILFGLSCALVMMCVPLVLPAGQVQAAAGQYLKLAAYDGGLTFYEGRCFRMDFLIQTDSLDANSVDIILPYDAAYVLPYSNAECTSPATQILSTGLFPSLPANIIDATRIRVTAYDPSGSDPVNTGPAPAHQSLGYIYWKVMDTHPAYPLSYDFTYGPYNTLDTNMAENNGDGTDVLDGVENVVFDFRSDVNAPYFTPVVPLDGAVNVSVTSPVTFVWTDTGAGVNQSTLQFSMNGVSFTPVQSGCTVTNSNRKPSCNAAVNPGLLQYKTLYSVTATGSDLAVTPNRGTRTWIFTTEDDVHAPYIQNFLPTNGATNVAVSSNISFNILDYKNNAGVVPGLGVDDESIVVTVTVGSNAPVEYRKSDAGVTITGTPANYLVVINPAVNFLQNTLVTVTVDAGDLHAPPNVMSTYTSSFTTIDSVGPVISDYFPEDDATEVVADTNVSFRITDAGAGVSINQTTVVVAGVSYTSASPRFTYTGDPTNYVVTIDPVANFTGGQNVTVLVSTRDLASPANTTSASWNFIIASTCSTCFVDTEDPGRFSTDAPLDTTLSFHVHDMGDGIDINSIRVQLIGTGSSIIQSTLTVASPQMIITGTPADYAVTISLPSSIVVNTPYAIVIDASNVNGLMMPTVRYSFMHLDTNPVVEPVECGPVITVTPPTPNGGHRGEMTLPAQAPRSWPEIIRRWFGSDGSVTREEPLSDLEARQVNRCYIDGGHEAAPRTHYKDVEPGVWYEDALERLLRRGALDASQQLFHADDSAVRAAFATMLVRLRSTLTPDATVSVSFDDTDATAWYHPFIEDAARHGWMLGYDDCYGIRPCFTKPLQIATRAEAAAMIVRTYALERLDHAPMFSDVSSAAWYADEVQIAADHCVLQGDAGSDFAAPDRIVNRAEMAVMLDRVERRMRYGIDCGTRSSVTGGLGATLLPSVPFSATLSFSGGILLMGAMGMLRVWYQRNSIYKRILRIFRF